MEEIPQEPVGFAPNVTTKPKSKVVDEGQKVIFKTVFTAKPAPMIVWSYKETTIESSEELKIELTEQEGDKFISTLTIPAAKPDDSGQYKVVISNDHGESTISVSLYVHGTFNSFVVTFY